MYVFLLLLIELILFLTNYEPGTYLMGWDNVRPEFNLWLNLKRSLFGVWQDYRGLGLLDGLSHTSNLFHTLYIAALSLVLPQSMLRYALIFLIHLVGGVAFYYLVRSLTKNDRASFFGALFYMLNLGVIQIFFAPLEVFAFHFAALPLLALVITNAVKRPSRKNFLILFLVSLLTTPQFFVPTFFLVFMIMFGSLLFFFYLDSKKIRQLLIVFLIFLAANAFWLLPYLYSFKYNAQVIPNTRINQFSSEEIFYRNKEFGDTLSVLRLNGFMLKAIEYDNQSHQNVFFMNVWRSYQNNTLYLVVFIAFLTIAGYGLVASVRAKRRSYAPYLVSLLIAFFFLANNAFILEQLNNLVRALPAIGEAFRFPFTKFIVLFSFCLAIFFTFGLSLIFERFSKAQRTLLIILPLALLILSYPAFRGNFVSPLLKVKLPADYRQTMEYLNTKDENLRIALLPSHTFWNWQALRWGYRGSGFIWYGIKQPILMRPFDPWSNYNEQFYNELSYAINSEDLVNFRNTLKKYNVSYLLLDQYVLNQVSSKPINYERLERFLAKTEFIEEEKTFGKIILYRNQIEPVKTALKLNLQTVYAPAIFTNIDRVYSDEGEYVQSENKPSRIYPFSSLITQKLQDDLVFDASDNQTSLKIALNNLAKFNGNYSLEIPDLFKSESLIPVRIIVENSNLLLYPLYPTFYINNQKVEVNPEPIIITPSAVRNPQKIILTDSNQTLTSGQQAYILNNYLNTFKLVDGVREELLTLDTRTIAKGNGFLIPLSGKSVDSIEVEVPKFASPFTYEDTLKSGDYKITSPAIDLEEPKQSRAYTRSDDHDRGNITLEAKRDSIDLSIWRANLFHNASYISFINSKYDTGLPVTFYLDNPYEKRAELETRLSKTVDKNVVIIPRSQEYFQGYGLHLIVKSSGNEIAKSTINKFSLYPFPLELLSRTRLVAKEKDSSTTLLVTNQSYHPGWKAYQDGKELKNHVLVNNWANGWRVENDNPVKIVFWPQYLEYVGFGLTIISFIYIIMRRKGY